MSLRILSLIILLVGCVGLGACQSFFFFPTAAVLPLAPSDSGVMTTSEDHEPEFLVESTKGVIQMRDDFDQPWRMMEPGERVKPSCQVRTGFNSTADLTLYDGDRTLKVKLASLLPEFELYDAYDKLLTPDAYAKHLREWVDKKGDCAHLDRIMICRSSLNPTEPNDFLEVANVTLELKNEQAGRSAGASGAGGSGASGSSGC